LNKYGIQIDTTKSKQEQFNQVLELGKKAFPLAKTQDTSKKLQQLASDLQQVTIYGDETTLAAMAMGINMGIAADKMEDTTRAAMGLAAAYSMDLTTAMQLLAKANAGNTGTLSRYGITIDTTKSKQEQFNQILKKGKDAFPLAEAQTTGQKLQQLANAWGDLMEVIGQFISELFDVKAAAASATSSIANLTTFIRKNMDEWIFQIKYVYAYVEASFKAIFAVIEPRLTFIGQIFTAAVQNIVAIAQWGMENVGKIWEHLPEIFVGIGKDINNYWENIFTGLYNLAKNFGKALWDAIRNGDTSGFEKMWEHLKDDAIRFVAEQGKYTENALAQAGATPFPELKQADFSGMIDKYKNMANTFADIDQQRIEKQARLEADYAKKLERSKTPANNKTDKGGADAAGKGKNDVAGSFSAAVLNAMLGSGSPEKETAKNTREMVRLQRQQLTKNTFDNSSTYD